jgi:hypothetical protein
VRECSRLVGAHWRLHVAVHHDGEDEGLTWTRDYEIPASYETENLFTCERGVDFQQHAAVLVSIGQRPEVGRELDGDRDGLGRQLFVVADLELGSWFNLLVTMLEFLWGKFRSYRP